MKLIPFGIALAISLGSLTQLTATPRTLRKFSEG